MGAHSGEQVTRKAGPAKVVVPASPEASGARFFTHVRENARRRSSAGSAWRPPLLPRGDRGTRTSISRRVHEAGPDT
jgi:hypothetical protein